jgi:rod shape-determining protein MreC
MNKDKYAACGGRFERILPFALSFVAVILMSLPLRLAVNSARAVLAYIFLPQIRTVANMAEYFAGAGESAVSLLNAASENLKLKNEIANLKTQNARLDVLQEENERLGKIVALKKKLKWEGVWARTIYRDPFRLGAMIVDKGSADGVTRRGAVLGVAGDSVGLAGEVISVGDSAAKILLCSDEEFSVACYLSGSGFEGLCSGSGEGGLIMTYLPLYAEIKVGDKVFTSASSAVFPGGVPIGRVSYLGDNGRAGVPPSFAVAQIKPAFEPFAAKEVFLLKALPAAPSFTSEGEIK